MSSDSPNSNSEIVVCPFCLKRFDSVDAWGQSFYTKHPFIQRLDSLFPIFNTPPIEAQVKHSMENQDP